MIISPSQRRPHPGGGDGQPDGAKQGGHSARVRSLPPVTNRRMSRSTPMSGTDGSSGSRISARMTRAPGLSAKLPADCPECERCPISDRVFG
jgi:hypothetical protein